MKILSTALLAAGLVALGGCGGASDTAANNVGAENYNLAPEEVGNDVLLGNETLGNDVLLDDGATNAADNAADGNVTNTQ